MPGLLEDHYLGFGLVSLETSLLGLQTAFFLCIHFPAVSFSKDTIPIGSGPTLMASLNFNYLFTGPIPSRVTLVAKSSTYASWGYTVQSTTDSDPLILL